MIDSMLFAAAFGCSGTKPSDLLPTVFPTPGIPLAGTATRTPFLPPTSSSRDQFSSPTPDAPRLLPTPRLETDQYVVQTGDSLGNIARLYGVSLDSLISANQIADPNLLSIGQALVIPPPELSDPGPSFKIIPDSELVYGPYSAYVDYPTLIESRGGFLAGYQEDVDEQPTSGLDIIRRVAQDYSVNPLLLLTLLEYQSGWLSQTDPSSEQQTYPMGLLNASRQGLYHQLAWAANELNRGFYLWRVNALGTWVLADNTIVPIDPTLNAGTAAVQYLFANLYGENGWRRAVTEQGVFATYSSLFGYPFNLSIDPVLPPDLAQPSLQLPFEPNQVWSFTGGPHGGWDSGSAWAALDFAPPGDALGCVQSNAWVVAAANGMIVRTGNGAVVQDLDGDGYEQTGWSILYMHVESRDRVKPGTVLKAGDRIGHPSCEGGVSTGTHLHIARRFNGEWIPADQSIPFVMDGWVSSGTGVEYDGFLTRNNQVVEAYVRRSPVNQIQRNP